MKNLIVTDPVIVEQAQDIFRELSQNEACLGPLQHRLVPTLISILQSAVDKVPSGLHGVALDVVETLVRASQPPLSDSLMQTFPCAIQLALTSDDPTIVQVFLYAYYYLITRIQNNTLLHLRVPSLFKLLLLLLWFKNSKSFFFIVCEKPIRNLCDVLAPQRILPGLKQLKESLTEYDNIF